MPNNFIIRLFSLFITAYLCLSSNGYSMNPSSTEDLLYTTLRITCKTNTGETSIGTGYIYDFLEPLPNDNNYKVLQIPQPVKKPYLVTNKHVIHDAITGEF